MMVFNMLEDSFCDVYMRFKLNFYENVFSKIQGRDGSLGATEAFSLEIINALGKPTVSEFARFINVSQSNATYKVNNLINKGYLEKENSDDDKREYHLLLTQKYYDYSNLSDEYINTVLNRVRQRFTDEQADSFDKMLSVIANELMSETQWYENKKAAKTVQQSYGGEKMEKKIMISAEKTCDLGEELLARYDIKTIPYHIILEGKDYSDSVDIFPQDLYEAYWNRKALPTTTAVNIVEYTDYFRPFVEQGYEIVHITLGSALSSANQNCLVAAQELGNIYVIDSKSLSTGIGHLAIEAALLRDGGLSAAEIAEKVTEMVPKVHASFVLDTLEFMAAGGRCSTVAALGANLLKLKPCIEVVSEKNGAMGVGKKYRGELSNVLVTYIKERLSMYDNIRTDKIFLTHSSGKVIDKKIIEIAKTAIGDKIKFDEIFVTTASCTISSHCGPGCLGILFMTE